jgi:hypothetical protein
MIDENKLERILVCCPTCNHGFIEERDIGEMKKGVLIAYSNAGYYLKQTRCNPCKKRYGEDDKDN